MSAEFWQIIITIVLVVTIVVFLFKRLLKVAIAVGAILLLFNVGFVMNGTEVRDFLGLDNFLDKKQAENVEYYLNDFDEKRDEYGVVDPEDVYDGMVGVATQGTVIIVDGIGKIDVIKFSQSVAQKIVNSGSDNIDTDALREEINQQLSGIKESDLDRIMDEIENHIEDSKEQTDKNIDQ